MLKKMTRRTFVAAAAAGISVAMTRAASAADKPAALGGKAVRAGGFPSWPVFDGEDEQAMLRVLRSGKWFRGYGKNVDQFEEAYAKLTGAKYCLATTNGTSSLVAALAAVGVEAGDEVIVPPYTFVATVNAVLLHHALPVFVDSDRETFQIDARKIEAAITSRTMAILPVHLGGGAADMDAILAVAQKRKIPVVEDACQSHIAEWRKKKVGTVGDAGCFSFQASKNLNCGEGGAILTNSEAVYERSYAFHTNGRTKTSGGMQWANTGRAGNFRMTEFQAALLMTQMTRLEQQARTRERNAEYLTKMLKEIPGIAPAKMHEGCTRNAYHLYMFRFQKEQFAGLSRAGFIRALGAEGIPVSSGYTPLNKQAFVANALKSRGFKALFSAGRLQRWEEQNQCPENDKLCEEGVWFTQNMLLGPREDMEQIAEGIKKIQAHAGELARA
jgi:dTDP-4-amino-4,6-dideoxygalactose transaminase